QPSTSPVGSAFVALKGQSFTGVIGSFTPANGYTTADYTALINWGDGQYSMASIDGSGNINYAHTFNAAGAYAIAFEVQNIHDNSTNVGIALGLVESLTSD